MLLRDNFRALLPHLFLRPFSRVILEFHKLRLLLFLTLFSLRPDLKMHIPNSELAVRLRRPSIANFLWTRGGQNGLHRAWGDCNTLRLIVRAATLVHILRKQNLIVKV